MLDPGKPNYKLNPPNKCHGCLRGYRRYIFQASIQSGRKQAFASGACLPGACLEGGLVLLKGTGIQALLRNCLLWTSNTYVKKLQNILIKNRDLQSTFISYQTVRYKNKLSLHNTFSLKHPISLSINSSRPKGLWGWIWCKLNEVEGGHKGELERVKWGLVETMEGAGGWPQQRHSLNGSQQPVSNKAVIRPFTISLTNPYLKISLNS
jgi:hypothetical protein